MEELLRLLPDEYGEPIKSRLCYYKLSEVRVIDRAPVRVCYDGGYKFLCRDGITADSEKAIFASDKEAERIVLRACERSLYTVSDTLKNGYISVRGGIRIGVCGSGVVSNGSIVAVKDFSSVNIRVPHEVKGCAATLFAKYVSHGYCNTLIVSPPGAGKTTVLRDLCRLVSDRGRAVLLCDEKYEIAASYSGIPSLDVGRCTDVMSGIGKAEVFRAGIANMRPDIVMTDELFGDELQLVRVAAKCGVSVVASVHSRNAAELLQKPKWAEAIREGLFGLFAFISDVPTRSLRIYEELEV